VSPVLRFREKRNGKWLDEAKWNAGSPDCGIEKQDKMERRMMGQASHDLLSVNITQIWQSQI
jgi:hypothetical protein